LTLRTQTFFPAAVLLAAAALTHHAYGQAEATAEAAVHLSAFAGVSANYTGLELARNGNVTAGVDVGFRTFRGFFPGVEVRGMYPIANSQVVNAKNILGGIRLGRRKERYNPYGDVLFGRGTLNFPNGYATPDNSFLVLSNTTNVLSFGGGLDYSLSTHWGVKGDFQFQKYNTPVTPSGSLYSKIFTAGIVYRLGSSSIQTRNR
jgi:hypothetical protein